MSTPTIDRPLVQPVTDGIDMAEFEKAFSQQIPCEFCPQPAEWRSFGHQVNDCGGTGHPYPPPYYKCTDCFITWAQQVDRDIAQWGSVRCCGCHVRFATRQEFSDYKRF